MADDLRDKPLHDAGDPEALLPLRTMIKLGSIEHAGAALSEGFCPASHDRLAPPSTEMLEGAGEALERDHPGAQVTARGECWPCDLTWSLLTLPGGTEAVRAETVYDDELRQSWTWMKRESLGGPHE